MPITMTNLSAGILPANLQTLIAAAQSNQTTTDIVTLTGDVAGSANILQPISTVIQPSAVTYAKMQNVSADRLVGNPTGMASAPSEISVGEGLGFSGSVLFALLYNFLGGLTLSNDATTPNTVTDVAPGLCVDSTNATTISFSTTFTKSISTAWTVGSGNGGLGQGISLSATTWYHVFVIINAGTADVYFDTSVTASNAPAGTTAFRRIGSVLTNGSSQIVPFTQKDDEFLWKTPIASVSGVTSSSVSAAKTMTVPTGVEVWAKIIGNVTEISSATLLLITAPDMGTQAVNSPTGFFQIDSNVDSTPVNADLTVRTNTSAQVNVVANGAGGTYSLITYGWIDRRGRGN
jgi:hypothetical protein